MNSASTVLLVLNYLAIMSLPLVFFEKHDRRLSVMWWVTAAPFIALPFALAAVLTDYTPLLTAQGGTIARTAGICAVIPSGLSIALIASALAVHHRHLPQWHQHQHCVPEPVTRGPYAYIRHPFYAAYLLMFAGFAALAPAIPTLGVFLYAVIVLNHTAAREEKQLSASTFGAAYRSYVLHTGRFLPKARRALVCAVDDTRAAS